MVSETPSRVTNRSDNGSKESSMAKDKTNDNAKIYISPRFKSAATMAGLTEMRGLHQLKRISISRSLFSFVNQTSLEPLMTRSSLSRPMSSAAVGCYRETPLLDSSPWSTLQRRGVKVNTIQLRAGNVIERTCLLLKFSHLLDIYIYII